MSASAKKATKTVRRHQEPSAEPLREMPERSREAKLLPNKFYAQIAKDGGLWLCVDGREPTWIPSSQGRPRKGEPSETTKPRSVRLPDSVWDALGRIAKSRGISRGALMTQVVIEWLKRKA